MTSKHTEFLRKHAMENVWCAPGQDGNFIFKLPALSSSGGSIGTIDITGPILDLPNAYDRFQVFMIGGVQPSVYGMVNALMHWVSHPEHSNTMKSALRVYTDDGVVFGAADVYYRYTGSGNLLVAVRMDNKLPVSWATDGIYLSLYKAAYWGAPEALVNPVGFEVVAQRIEQSSDVSDFNVVYNAAVATVDAPHQLRYWRNGVSCIYNAAEIEVGDSVWFEIDGSIKELHRFNVQGLGSFGSSLDAVRKYLLHLPKNNLFGIDFIDDLELFITTTNSKQTGLKYVPVQQSHLRQLTHRDYSIPVTNVTYQSQTLSAITSTISNTHAIEVVVRTGARRFELVREAAFITEMYRLDDASIVAAMIGTESTVPFWKADSLEASDYVALMRARTLADLTYEKVENAYGYYAMSRALGEMPLEVQSPGSTGWVDVPYIYMWGATMYEYDADGLFLGHHLHILGNRYFTNSPEATHVEVIAGYGSNILEEMHGIREGNLTKDATLRVYLRQKVGGVIQPAYTDVTGSNRYTIDEEGNFTWLNAAPTDYVTVRTDRRFFAADYYTDVVDGFITITLNTMQTHDGVAGLRKMTIGMGQWDVILNGRSLIRGLHYFYRDGTIVVTARDYIDQTPGVKQKVHVRGLGFEKSDKTMYDEGDWGFIRHGLLSQNSRFSIRDGRVSRVIVDGRLKTMDQLVFAEDSNAVSPVNAVNGMPYMIKDVYVPLRPFAKPDTWELLDAARKRAKQVEDYLTRKLPEPDRGLVTIAQRHRIVSPFLSKILFDMIYGRLTPPSGEITRQQVVDVCKSYEPLLKTDALQTGFDGAFVDIVPHHRNDPITITVTQWGFLDKVVRYYAPGLVDLHTTLRVSN